MFFIMWVSGAGKWTLLKNLRAGELSDLFFLKSYVTRPMREWEVDGEIYNFISPENFQVSIDADEFLEYEWVHKTAYYGTKWADAIENGIDAWKKVLKEIEIAGLKNILTNNPQIRPNMTSIFLDISPETLRERIKMRGATMTDLDLSNRLDSLEIEKRDSKTYCDHIIDTSDLTPEQVLEQVVSIINK